MKVENGAQVDRERQYWIAAAGWFGALVIALVVGVLMSGCGRQSSSSQQASASTQSVVAIPAGSTNATTASMPMPSSATPVSVPIGKVSETSGAAPDIAVSVPDTLVMLGQTVEFKVEATPDVTEIALTDGLNDTQSFVRDAGSNVWRVNYRVPLRSRLERFGVSVTARTEQHRWRRLWVFLHVDMPTPEQEPQVIPHKEPGSGL